MRSTQKIQKIEDLKVFLHRHRSAKDIILSFYNTEYKKSRNKKAFLSRESNLFVGKKTIKDAIKEANKRGLWGYCHINKENGFREIHYWMTRNTECYDLAELLCHEVAHAVGIKSEKIAVKYAYVASTVLQLLLRDFKRYLK